MINKILHLNIHYTRTLNKHAKDAKQYVEIMTAPRQS